MSRFERDIDRDCACGHPKIGHGRRGYGSCAVIYPTDATTEAAERWRRDYSPEVAGRLFYIALHLPGGHVPCGCKRFHVRPVASAAAGKGTPT